MTKALKVIHFQTDIKKQTFQNIKSVQSTPLTTLGSDIVMLCQTKRKSYSLATMAKFIA